MGKFSFFPFFSTISGPILILKPAIEFLREGASFEVKIFIFGFLKGPKIAKILIFQAFKWPKGGPKKVAAENKCQIRNPRIF